MAFSSNDSSAAADVDVAFGSAPALTSDAASPPVPDPPSDDPPHAAATAGHAAIVELLLDARNFSAVSLYLVGQEELKGVMFGRPYPIVWMLDAEETFAFLPWEIEQDTLMAAASKAAPTPVSDLQRIITDMRHYLKKMHGRDRPPVTLG